MSVIKFLRDWTDLFNWSTDENPTTQQDYQEAVKNWIETEKNIVDSHLWQPETEYHVDNIVKTPSLPSQYYLVCITAGTSGANEPDYTNVELGDEINDGTVTWVIASGAKVERVNKSGISSSGYGYICYESGIQICFGRVELSTNQTSYVTYPVPFISIPSVGVSIERNVYVRVFGSSQATGFSVSCSDTSNNNNVKWVSVGWWK